MISVEITETGVSLEALVKGFRQEIMNRFIELSTDYIKETMGNEVPVKTGKLRSSIKTEVSGETAKIGPTVYYWPYVEYGTSPHVIVPIRASVLAFEIAGETIFSQRVFHPGTTANPFIERTMQQYDTVKFKLFTDSWKRGIDRARR